MKILKNNIENKNVKTPRVLKVCCEKCQSELEITEDDTHIGWLGSAYITCPCCDEESAVDEIKGITLTELNVTFPTHFIRTNSSLGNVKEIDNSEVEENIRQGIESLRKNKEEHLWYTEYGDLFLMILKYPGDEEYVVMVTKDFYETCIPFQKEDYE